MNISKKLVHMAPKKKQTKYEQQNRLHMSFRDSFFIWIINLWSALPFAIRSEVKLVPFKKKLNHFFVID